MVGFISVTIRTPRDRGGSGGFVVLFLWAAASFLGCSFFSFLKREITEGKYNSKNFGVCWPTNHLTMIKVWFGRGSCHFHLPFPGSEYRQMKEMWYMTWCSGTWLGLWDLSSSLQGFHPNLAFLGFQRQCWDSLDWSSTLFTHDFTLVTSHPAFP